MDRISSHVDPLSKNSFKELSDKQNQAGFGYLVAIINNYLFVDGAGFINQYIRNQEKTFISLPKVQTSDLYYMEPRYNIEGVQPTFNYLCTSDELINKTPGNKRFWTLIIANDLNATRSDRAVCQAALGIYYQSLKELKKALHHYHMAQSESTDLDVMITLKIALCDDREK